MTPSARKRVWMMLLVYAACLFLKQMMTVRRVGTTCMNLEKTMKMTMMTKVEKWTMIGTKAGIGREEEDPNKCIATEKEILSILPIKDLQQCENRLVQVLQYENFEFTKLLLKNRLKILYCTRLGQAQTEEDKTAVLEDMRNTPEAQAVLEELDKASKKRDRERDINRDLRKEVRQLQLRGAREKERGMDDEGSQTLGRGRAKVAEEQRLPWASKRNRNNVKIWK
ncbi:unnamed protein product [Durusdinium trenchii]|uniref:Brr2 N-terminal helicase PWI domain-containing protein n=1 Tax=Durusdinium trenchii TaxID=1381693 RepID=A0ABP0SFY8_9DINO